MSTFTRETNKNLVSKNGKLMQNFVVKNDDGETSGIYALWSDSDGQVYPKGVYEIETYDIVFRNNSGFTNLVITNPTFRLVK